jgi:glutamate dehydrogenase/leucine dehydrogenase
MAPHHPDGAARIVGLDPRLREVLRERVRELHLSLPVRMDDGEVKRFEGFFIQFNQARGPAKGGVLCDATKLSARERARLSEAYVEAVRWIVPTEHDVALPDLYGPALG